MMNMLVTGAAGYIGSCVVKQLIQTTKNNITIIDSFKIDFVNTIKILDLKNWQPKYDNLEFIYKITLEWEKKLD